MLTSNSSLNNKFKRGITVLFFLAILSANSILLSAASLKQAIVISPETLTVTPAAPTPSPSGNPILDFTLDIVSESAIVVEVGRGMKLYLKNPELRMNISVASKIMTAVIAIAAIPLDTKVTISKVAADKPDSGRLSLVSGEKYSLEYLLYGLLLTDNDAAAIAIAEQISGEEADFVELMNNEALSYKMDNTSFTNVTGEPDSSQYTTVSDVARLVRYALTFPKFETIMKTKDIPFFLSTNQTKHLFSNIENAWSLIDTTTGAIKSDSTAGSSFVTSAISNGINIIIVGSNLSSSGIFDDISRMADSVFSEYEFSMLVMEGQSFPKSIQIGNDTINLRFNQEITYIHPKDNGFIHTTTYEENATIEYPILTTKAIAKVVFELMDGTKITADLFPSVNLWDESNYIQKLVLLYNANPDIGLLIIIVLAMLLITCVYHFIRQAMRLKRFFSKGIRTGPVQAGTSSDDSAQPSNEFLPETGGKNDVDKDDPDSEDDAVVSKPKL